MKALDRVLAIGLAEIDATRLTTLQKLAVAMSVPCPQCKAPAGVECTSPPPIGIDVHAGRRDAVFGGDHA